MAKAKGIVLGSTSVPPYVILVIGDTHLLIAGGGGSSKTGVHNKIEIFAFEAGDYDNDELQLKLVKTTVIDVDKAAVMNGDILNKVVENGNLGPCLFAAGLDEKCQIWELLPAVHYMHDGQVVPPTWLVNRQRRSSAQRHPTNMHQPHHLQNGIPPNGVHSKHLGYDERVLKSFQSDSAPKGRQKCVRLVDGGKIAITGGVDGHLRIWELPSGKKLWDHNAHKNEIEEFDVSADGKKLISIGRDDHKGLAWNIENPQAPKKFGDLDAHISKESRYRCVRFSKLGRLGPLFYTVGIPISRGGTKKKFNSVIAQWAWAAEELIYAKSLPLPNEIVSCLAISDDCLHLAVGTVEGSVFIMDALELCKLRHIRETHGYVVTKIAFLPSAPSEGSTINAVVSNSRCGVISISGDLTIQLHLVPKNSRNNGSFIGWLFFIVFWTTLAAFLLTYIGL